MPLTIRVFYVLAITGFTHILSSGTLGAALEINPLTIMTAKKTEKSTTEPAANGSASAATPATKKVAKKATKKVASAKTVKSPTPKTVTPKATAKSSLDVIARAAYLNYRRRVEQGLPGDSHGDWLEAEKNLGNINEF